MDSINVNGQQPAVQDQLFETVLGDAGFDPQVLAKEIVPLLQAAGALIVTDGVKGGDGEINSKELIPEIDPAEVNDLAADMAKLEELIALLTLENDEEQAKAIQARIQQKIDDLEAKHAETLKKIQEAVDKAVEQAKAAERNKILGWIMTSLAVLAAGISIAMTAGAAAPSAVMIAACVLSCTGSAIGLTTQILEETGTMDKIIEHYAEAYAKEHDVSLAEAKQEMQKRAQIVMMVIQGALALASLGCGIASMVSAAKTAAQAATEVGKSVSEAGGQASKFSAKTMLLLRWSQMSTQGLSLTGGVTQNILQYLDTKLAKQAADEEAQLAELKALLDAIKDGIEQDQDRLEQLLEQIQSMLGVLTAIFTEPIETANDIMNQFKQGV